ncbi:hypothetical protein M885DRAFT_618195 [Pelagophyceae sp. CCMP2097]|nr:hypothetical protein M885DRAFT_618195 [Pelagophyceae sp. CCMP2097]
MQLVSLLALVAGAAAFTITPAPAQGVAMMGRNDKRTRRGKVYAESNGICRPKKKKQAGKVVDPYFTLRAPLREWGNRQDPPMSVQQVITAKMAEKMKVVMSPEDLLAALTPI